MIAIEELSKRCTVHYILSTLKKWNSKKDSLKTLETVYGIVHSIFYWLFYRKHKYMQDAVPLVGGSVSVFLDH